MNRASLAHDIFTILFILMLTVYIVTVLAVRAHRRLLSSWFTGEIRDG
jgi:hypothetical protein